MKTLFLTLLLLLPVACFANQAISYYQDAQGKPLTNCTTYIFYYGPTNRFSTNTVTVDRLKQTTDINGFFTFTNFIAGVYRYEHQGPYKVTTNWYLFPATNGTIYASDPQWGILPTNQLSGVNTVYTKSAVDALIAANSSNPNALTNNNASAATFQSTVQAEGDFIGGLSIGGLSIAGSAINIDGDSGIFTGTLFDGLVSATNLVDTVALGTAAFASTNQFIPTNNGVGSNLTLLGGTAANQILTTSTNLTSSTAIEYTTIDISTGPGPVFTNITKHYVVGNHSDGLNLSFDNTPGDSAYGTIYMHTTHGGPASPANTEFQISSPGNIAIDVAGHIQLGIGAKSYWSYWQNAINIAAATPYGNSGAQTWRTTGLVGGNSIDYFPGILGIFIDTNTTHQLYALQIVTDLGNNTGIAGAGNFNNVWNLSTLTKGLEIYGGFKRGLRINGGVVNERSVLTSSAAMLAMDFGKGNCVDYAISGATIALSTTNIWNGATNSLVGGDPNSYEERTFILRSGGGPFTVTPNLNWETNGVAIPTSVSSGQMLILKLAAIGGVGETNIAPLYAQVHADKTFAWDVDALSFLSRASITDSTMSNAVNYLSTAYKAASLWAKRDGIYPIVGGNATAHGINLKGASYTITWHGTVTNDANGITGNGSTGYGDTGFNPSTALGQVSLNSASLFGYVGTASLPAGVYFGCFNSGSDRFYVVQGSSSQFAVPALNGASGVDVSPSTGGDARGLFLATRTSGSSESAYDNFTSQTSGTSTSSSLPNANICVLARGGGGPDNFTTINLRGFGFGAGVSPPDAATERAIWDTYESILGRKVP